MQLQFIIMLAEAFVILFELRALMQSSNIDYYHHVTQAVVKLTEPVIKFLPFRNYNIKGFYLCGIAVAFVIALAFSAVFFTYFGHMFAPGLILTFALCMTLKSFGYLILFLPSTRQWSYMCGLLTYPIVRPVQKIIPPIGMIDISLMIVMLAIFALNSLFLRIFGAVWMAL